MSNSSLVTYTKISPNRTSPRNKPITKITIHHMATVNLSVEKCGEIFQNKSRKASSNYGIGSDGKIALYVSEEDKSLCSSNSDNDNRAVTIEVANSKGEPNWEVSEKAYNALIDLCVDICQRNGIKELNWTGDKSGNLTCHYMFKATACPGNYLKGKMPEIAKAVNARLNAQKPQEQPKTNKVDKVSTTSTNKLENAQKKVPGMEKGKTLKVNAKNGLNIRTGAGVNKPLAGNPVPKGTEVKWYGYYSVENNKTWYLVKAGNTTGYCLSSYLEG